MIWASLLLPFLLSPLAGYLSLRRRDAEAVIVILASLAPLGVLSMISVFGGARISDVGPSMFYGFPGNLIITPFNGLFVMTIFLVGSLVAVFSVPYMEHRAEELGVSNSVFYFTYPIFVASMCGVVTSESLITIYVFFEISLISSLFQVLYYGYGDRVRISLMYLVWTHVGALLMLIGFIMLLLRGTTVAPMYLGHPIEVPEIAAYLILLGSLIKMASLGVHMWLPYVHAEAPTPLSALLSPVLVGLGGYVIIAVLVAGGAVSKLANILMAYAILTGIYGALMAYVQTDIKRLLAYSTISQMGYMLLAISTMSKLGLTGAALHYLAHGLGKAVLFMSAGYLILYLRTRDLGKMGGLYAAHAPLSIFAIIGFLNLVGILTVGMIAELAIVFAVAEVVPLSNFWYYVGVAAMLISSAVYAFNTIRVAFFGPPKSTQSVPRDFRWYLTITPIGALAVASLLFLAPPLSTTMWRTVYNIASSLVGGP